MKISIATIIIGLLLICSTGASAQSGNNAQCQDPSSSLVWQISNKDTTVYLFGTLHFGKKSFYPLAPEIESAFRSADHLVFEIDIEESQEIEFALKMQSTGLYPPGKSLKQTLSPKTLEKVVTTTQALGLPSEPLMQFKPWFLTITLTAQHLINLGYHPDFGIESYLNNEKSAKTSLLELETLDAQLEFMQALNKESFLEYTLDSLNEGGDLLEDIAKAWECADKSALQALLIDSFDDATLTAKEANQLKDLFLIDRNEKMAGKISDFLTSGSGTYFVAVGAAHYLGEGSIIEFLQNKDFDIKSIKLERR